MPLVTSRWHVVLSKNFWLARYVKLAAEHGAFVTSSLIVIVPWLVAIVMSRVPESGRFFVDGVPVFFSAVLLPSAGFHVQEAPVAAAAVPLDDVPCELPLTASQTKPPIATIVATSAPTTAAARGRGCSTLLMTPSVRPHTHATAAKFSMPTCPPPTRSTLARDHRRTRCA
jgi:hypothetical protein